MSSERRAHVLYIFWLHLCKGLTLEPYPTFSISLFYCGGGHSKYATIYIMYFHHKLSEAIHIHSCNVDFSNLTCSIKQIIRESIYSTKPRCEWSMSWSLSADPCPRHTHTLSMLTLCGVLIIKMSTIYPSNPTKRTKWAIVITSRWMVGYWYKLDYKLLADKFT